jgi:tetratricopeptide (TPR) repeat protein
MQFEKKSKQSDAAQNAFARAKQLHGSANLLEAQAALVEAIAQLTCTFGETHLDLVECYEMLGDNAFAQDKFEDALFSLQTCLERKKIMRANPADSLELKLTIALAKMKLKRLEEADADLVALRKEAESLLVGDHPLLSVVIDAQKSVQKQLPARRKALLEAEEKAYIGRQKEKKESKGHAKTLRTHDEFSQPLNQRASNFLESFAGGSRMVWPLLASVVAVLILVALPGLNLGNPLLLQPEGSYYQGMAALKLTHDTWQITENNKVVFGPIPYVAIKDVQSLAKALITKSTYWTILDPKGLIDEDGHRYFSQSTKEAELLTAGQSQEFFVNSKYQSNHRYPTIFVDSLMSVPSESWDDAYDTTYRNPFRNGSSDDDHPIAQVSHDIVVPGVPLDQQMNALLKGASWDGDIHEPGTIGFLNYCPPGKQGIFLIHFSGSDGRLLSDKNGPMVMILRDGKMDLPKMADKKINLIVIAPQSRKDTITFIQIASALVFTISTAIILVLQIRFHVSIFELAMNAPQWLKMAGLVLVVEAVLGLVSINVEATTAMILAVIQTLVLVAALVGCLLWWGHKHE